MVRTVARGTKMTNVELNEMAVKLGIKPTRAAVGSEIFECWRDRVYLCWNLLLVGEREANSAGFDFGRLGRHISEAREWANAYAL